MATGNYAPAQSLYRYYSGGYGATPASETKQSSFQIIVPDNSHASYQAPLSAIVDKVFPPPKAGNFELSDFVSGKVDVEKNQLQILLEQMELRYRISRQIRDNLLYRHLKLSSELLNIAPGYALRGKEKEKTSLEKRMDEIEKEKNMEYVALWRDTQKILLEIFKHWSSHSSLERRSEVMKGDF